MPSSLVVKNGVNSCTATSSEMPTPVSITANSTQRLQPAASGARSRWVEFAVMDTGVGISEDVAVQLFTPFFTTREEGMGLGLSLCRTVIEQHGGYLGFKALQPQGTMFHFTLPVAITANPIKVAVPSVTALAVST